MDLILETDRMPCAGESMECHDVTSAPGGKGANTAVAIHRAGHHHCQTSYESEHDIQVFMNGAVGDDETGRVLRTNLEQNGVNVSKVQTISNTKSGTCIVIVDKESNDSRNIGYQGANLQWTANNAISLTGESKPTLVVGFLGVRHEQVTGALQYAKQNNVSTLFSPSPPVTDLDHTIFKDLDHLVLNQHEATIILGQQLSVREIIDIFIKKGVKNVVLTLGSNGAAYATSGGQFGTVEAVKIVNVVDTTGAGFVRHFCLQTLCLSLTKNNLFSDTFTGYYAADYLLQTQWNVELAVSRACKAAARTIQRLGAQEAIPWADEIK